MTFDLDILQAVHHDPVYALDFRQSGSQEEHYLFLLWLWVHVARWHESLEDIASNVLGTRMVGATSSEGLFLVSLRSGKLMGRQLMVRLLCFSTNVCRKRNEFNELWSVNVNVSLCWRRGVVVSVVCRMNEVTLRWARLVLGWVTVFFGRV